MRASSSVRIDTVAQSTSHTTTLPPGLSARWISRSAAVTSGTYSSTCTLSAASNSPSATGSDVASASWKATFCRPSERRAASARLAALPSTPTTEPSGSHGVEQLGHVEARAAAHVEDPLSGGRPEGFVDQAPPAAHVALLVRPLELLHDAVVELEAVHGAQPRARP